MKKILSFLLSVTLVFTLLGSSGSAFATVDASNQSNPQSDAAKEDAEKKAEGGTPEGTDNSTANNENASGSNTSFSAPPEVKSDSYIVIDATTSQVLISKNRDKKQFPADLSMIMTAALSLETIGADNLSTATRTLTAQDLFRNGVAPNNFAPRWIAYDVGETVSGETLMTCTLLGPYDDCATALANLAAESSGSAPAQSTTTAEGSENLPASSTDLFVQMMNQKAKSIGLQNTHFASPRGSYNEEQYTTAFDMAQIVRYAINLEGFQKYFSRNTYNVPPSSKHNETRTASRPSYAMMNPDNSIYCKDTFGIKTGYNDQSNSTGVAATTRNGKTLIAVVLNCPGKDASLPQTDMSQLLEYCFANFQSVTFTEEDIKPVSLNIYDTRDAETHSIIGKATVSIGGDLTLLVHKKYSQKDIGIVSDIPGHFFKNENNLATITFTLNASEESGIQYMDSNMGKLGLKIDTTLNEEIEAAKKARQAAIWAEVKKWSKIVGITVLVIVVLLIAIRFYNIQRYKKIAAKKRAAKRRREKLKKQ